MTAWSEEKILEQLGHEGAYILDVGRSSEELRKILEDLTIRDLITCSPTSYPGQTLYELNRLG